MGGSVITSSGPTRHGFIRHPFRDCRARLKRVLRRATHVGNSPGLQKRTTGSLRGYRSIDHNRASPITVVTVVAEELRRSFPFKGKAGMGMGRFCNDQILIHSSIPTPDLFKLTVH